LLPPSRLVGGDDARLAIALTGEEHVQLSAIVCCSASNEAAFVGMPGPDPLHSLSLQERLDGLLVLDIVVVEHVLFRLR
jgi:hypothetical protein